MNASKVARVSATLVEQKLARIRGGAAPRVLELCSGAGGMALGFGNAGFELCAHVESSPEAVATYQRNLMRGATERVDGSDDARSVLDMSANSVSEIARVFGIDAAEKDAFDILVAGLPCQAFARVGRSKLSSVRGVRDAYKSDPRASLYERFIEIIEEVLPIAVVLENVPDIMNFGGRNVPEEIARRLDSLGYRAVYGLLNASAFGVPQHRVRLFLVAVRNELGAVPNLPVPSHSSVVPKGYESSSRVALKFVPPDSRHFREGLPARIDAPPAVSTAEALTDLPRITYHLTAGRRNRPADAALSYPAAAEASTYATLMRALPDGSRISRSSGHVVRLTPRDFETFCRMAPGDDYPKALAVAEQRYAELGASQLCAAGAVEDVVARELVVPPYDASKFPNRWWKLVPEHPARTLTAHLGKDTYTHIHYDNSQARMISLREAARLQSFPDWYEFGTSMNAGFRQIGNAVPPLLAQAVAVELLSVLRA